jgi:hypothetical protein
LGQGVESTVKHGALGLRQYIAANFSIKGVGPATIK